MDDSAEYEAWNPHGTFSVDEMGNPPFQSHSVSTFKWACKLVQILNQLLIDVYNPVKLDNVKHRRVQECTRLQKVALQQWWADLPDYLRMLPEGLPLRCPPSHIVTLKYYPLLGLLMISLLTAFG